MPGTDICHPARLGSWGRRLSMSRCCAGMACKAPTNRRALADRAGVRSFAGGVFDPAAVDAAMDGCDAAVHLVGIIFENPSAGVTFDRIHTQGTRAIVEAAQRRGVKRFVQMSWLGTRQVLRPARITRPNSRPEEIVVQFGSMDDTSAALGFTGRAANS